eukprot:7414134-Pyramimonas_sp.AAC.1
MTSALLDRGLRLGELPGSRCGSRSGRGFLLYTTMSGTPVATFLATSAPDLDGVQPDRDAPFLKRRKTVRSFEELEDRWGVQLS